MQDCFLSTHIIGKAFYTRYLDANNYWGFVCSGTVHVGYPIYITILRSMLKLTRSWTARTLCYGTCSRTDVARRWKTYVSRPLWESSRLQLSLITTVRISPLPLGFKLMAFLPWEQYYPIGRMPTAVEESVRAEEPEDLRAKAPAYK